MAASELSVFQNLCFLIPTLGASLFGFWLSLWLEGEETWKSSWNLVDRGVQHQKWGGNTYPGERKLLFEIKKGRLKTRKYVFTKPGKWPSQYLYLKVNSGFRAKKNPKQKYLWSSHVEWCFIQQKAHLCLWPCSLDNTLNRPSSALESFNIRQKLGLFVLGVTHILNLPTVCVKRTLRFYIWNVGFC